MNLILAGLSHRTAPLEIRERFAFTPAEMADQLHRLVAEASVSEAAILSTCNRSEVYAAVQEAQVDGVLDRIVTWLSRSRGSEPGVVEEHGYLLTADGAVGHLLRVASSLDSLVVGEAQILGQVRTALATAHDAGTAGPAVTGAFQHAIRCGKRVQTETGLGRGPFSVGRAAVDLARSIFGSLAHATVLVLGAGKMSELTIRHLVDDGVRFVIVANRSRERAERLAATFGGKAVPYDSFDEHLGTADIVISSTASPRPILTAERLRPALRARRGKPLFIVDIAVPRDVSREVAHLPNVFLKNVDDLLEVVDTGAAGREAAAVRAAEIVDEETGRLVDWLQGRRSAPAIGRVVERLEQIRVDALHGVREHGDPLTDEQWERVDAATRRMMRKVSRGAIRALKEEMPDAARSDLEAALAEIFDLAPGADAVEP